MYGIEVRRRVLELRAAGVSIRGIAARVGVSTHTVQNWIRDPGRAERRVDQWCHRCTGNDLAAPAAYGYLLGQYLGDGHLVMSARIPVLRIYACLDYLGILHEIECAIAACVGDRRDESSPRSPTD